MKHELNLAAMEERHRSAVRWEHIRAAYFQRIGKPDHATRCKLIAAHHENMAREARREAKR